MAGQLTHIGFIADGNRRWAKERGLPTLKGHQKGADIFDMIIEELLKTDVKYVSFFSFSTENWDRSPEEVSYLMDLIGAKISQLTKKAKKSNVRTVIMGRPERVDPNLWRSLLDAEEQTKDNDKLTVCFCFNYGGHWEIADAAAKMLAAEEQNFTPESFRKYLYHPEVPDCDLIVRTSGEERLSGFQLWRASYAELLFLDKHFPALEPRDITYVLAEYQKRQRRFGK